jgi:hypothetical protein
VLTEARPFAAINMSIFSHDESYKRMIDMHLDYIIACDSAASAEKRKAARSSTALYRSVTYEFSGSPPYGQP